MSEEKSSKNLAREWDRIREHLKRLRFQVRTAEVELSNATNALGKHINPGDQAVDEVFSLWVRFEFEDERLLSSIKDGAHNYRVVEGKHRKTLKPLPKPELVAE